MVFSSPLRVLVTGLVLVSFASHLFEGTKGASSNANALTIDLDGLQIHPLTASGGDVRVAAGVAVQSGFPG